ncbi:PEP-CTERM sorting domain-containing protein [Coraliomargarita parva]|uniref:PEP-CTERM sorting domain-containing protein n=1 Tax=Coraliomargarita parva TaxID=3014050 RepID=UPI0022B4DB7E|nr:PEP-CTERM sorting domain-containing protein [Coraliomargarita parva]
MRNQIYFTSFLTLLGLVTSAARSQADVLINDSFDVGASPTLADDGDDPNDTSWTAVAGYTSTALSTTDQLGSGNSLYGNVGGQSVNLLKTTFTEQTLSQVGASLSVSFDYRTQSTLSSGNSYVPAFGFYDSDGGTSSSNSLAPDGFEGYFARVDYDRVFLQGETGLDHLSVAGSDVFDQANQYYTDMAGTVGNFDGSERNFTFTITRIADTGADGFDDIQMTITGIDPTNSTNNFSFSSISNVTSAQDYEFDMLGIRSRAANYWIDNIVVTSSIPEPNTFALFGGSLALGAVMLRRRRK